ncbi:unnamed protein product [Fusarium venenatum]|uniref:Uncharacterized protein n=1 Tax=Fusarium venenatum TaxID=56646 RepID=A0A2L2SZ13_9HYPO|nr:LOW QUALITY PROTEIN: uncharacterized protein FVRRES_04599 [Fusarium venenatum]CEI60163.1 unnamed protein product [Fusarium venenatum]
MSLLHFLGSIHRPAFYHVENYPGTPSTLSLWHCPFQKKPPCGKALFYMRLASGQKGLQKDNCLLSSPCAAITNHSNFASGSGTERLRKASDWPENKTSSVRTRMVRLPNSLPIGPISFNGLSIYFWRITTFFMYVLSCMQQRHLSGARVLLGLAHFAMCVG